VGLPQTLSLAIVALRLDVFKRLLQQQQHLSMEVIMALEFTQQQLIHLSDGLADRMQLYRENDPQEFEECKKLFKRVNDEYIRVFEQNVDKQMQIISRKEEESQ
jgi:hypothetical protein